MKILASVRQDDLLGLAGLIVIVQVPGRASYRSRTPGRKVLRDPSLRGLTKLKAAGLMYGRVNVLSALSGNLSGWRIESTDKSTSR
jgi:hypothetical protein